MQPPLVNAEGMAGVGCEALGELGQFAQFAGGDVAEQEPVVPFATGLLQFLVAGGEAAS